MKKLLALILLVMPAQAIAWESSVGASYQFRKYHTDDQLGAIAPHVGLNPTLYNGGMISGDFLFSLGEEILGPEFSLGWGQLSVPHQSGYITKTAGEIVTEKLSVLVATFSAKLELLKLGKLQTYLKPGVVINTLFSGTKKVDSDTSGMVSLEWNIGVSSSLKLSVDAQAFVSPSVSGASEFVPSFGLVIGLRQVFISKPSVKEKTIERVVEKTVDPPAPVTPVALSIPSTPAVALSAPATPETKVETKKDEHITPTVAKTSLEIQKITLKLGEDGKLDPASYVLIEKVIVVYKNKPSIIKIVHRNEKTAQQLVEEIKNYILQNGCSTGDISLESSSTLEKPIKINVIPK